jgi:transcriptional regulator with XRE-family HTH domain
LYIGWRLVRHCRIVLAAMHQDSKQALLANQRRLAAAVKRLREERHLTQEQVADRILERTGYKYDHKHLSLVERGKVNITLEFLTLIAIGLDVDVSRLLQPEPDAAAAADTTYHVSERILQEFERGISSVRRNRVRSQGKSK